LPRFDFTLQIGASEFPVLIRQLVWYALEFQRLTPESFTDGRHDGCWGGGGTHGRYAFLDRGGPSEVEYNRLLLEWKPREKAINVSKAEG